MLCLSRLGYSCGLDKFRFGINKHGSDIPVHVVALYVLVKNGLVGFRKLKMLSKLDNGRSWADVIRTDRDTSNFETFDKLVNSLDTEYNGYQFDSGDKYFDWKLECLLDGEDIQIDSICTSEEMDEDYFDIKVYSECEKHLNILDTVEKLERYIQEMYDSLC